MSVPTFLHPALLLPNDQQPDFAETTGLQPSLLTELYGPSVRALTKDELNYGSARAYMSRVAVACYKNLGGAMPVPIFFERLHQELNWYEKVFQLLPHATARHLYLRETITVLFPGPYVNRRWQDFDPIDFLLDTALELMVYEIRFQKQSIAVNSGQSQLARELWAFMCARVTAEDVAAVELPDLFELAAVFRVKS